MKFKVGDKIFQMSGGKRIEGEITEIASDIKSFACCVLWNDNSIISTEDSRELKLQIPEYVRDWKKSLSDA